MNQFDLERMHEDVKIVDVSQVNASSLSFTFVNDGSYTAHLVVLWIDNSTSHQRYDISVFINAGETATYIQARISVPENPYTIKIVTERGNAAVYLVS